LYIVGVKKKEKEEKSRKIGKIQKEVSRWISGRHTVEEYNRSLKEV
jgi:hypothetical protein